MESSGTSLFREQLAFLRGSQFWSRRDLEAYQIRELRSLLRHCADHVPYYRDLFAEMGIRPDSIHNLEDIRAIPLLTKEIIKSRYNEFLSSTLLEGEHDYMTTGGSTGAPLKVMMDKRFHALDLANTYYYMDVAGFDPERYRSVRLHGNIVDPSLIRKGIYWVCEDGRRLVLSSYHISRETAPLYVDAINEHRPNYLHAFPSSAALLAFYIDKLHLSLRPSLKCIFTDCEVLYDSQRDLLERVFACRVFNTYGHTEGSVLGITCPRSHKIHLVPQVGITELLDQDGHPVTTPGEKGEIVVTGFYNRVLPFIRYRTQDIGVLSREPCPCEREYPLLERVEGRLQDYVVDVSGNQVPLAPALFDYNFDWSGVDRFQVFQDCPGRLTFRIVPEPGSGAGFGRLAARIRTCFGQILGRGFAIDVVLVDAIARTSRGKYRYLEQRLDMGPVFTGMGR